MAERKDLDAMFNPKSVAVVGASANPGGRGGAGFLGRLKKQEFPGRLYPVNPKATEVQGLKAYPDVRSLPEPPDPDLERDQRPGILPSDGHHVAHRFLAISGQRLHQVPGGVFKIAAQE